MPLTTALPFDVPVLAGLDLKRNSQQASRSFVSPAISRHQAPDAGRAQMTVKTWYSEELAGVHLVSVPVTVNDEDGTQVPGMRVFAGRRLDSFFLDFQRIAKGQLRT